MATSTLDTQLLAERFQNEHTVTTDVDISSDAFWSQPFYQRDAAFSRLRAEAPVSWHPALEDPAWLQDAWQDNPDASERPYEAGFWAVVRAEDIRYVSANNELFSSAGTIVIRPQHPATAREPSFIEMDPPFHTRYRKVMSAAFTPKAVARLTDQINERARRIVDAVVGAGQIDFVEQVAALLPMQTVADMIGVPPSLSGDFARAANNIIGGADAEVRAGQTTDDFVFQQFSVLAQIGTDLIHHRRKHPTDDVATALALAEFDGAPLSDADILGVMILLSIAGNDTTKQTTSHTAFALHQHPDQKAWLLEDFEGRIGSATDEFIRWASPVIGMCRTATQDLELGGEKILRGDKVGIFYCSGNRDESVYDDPFRFDLSRRAPHVGFGGGGVHYCLGNGVAKAQLRALYSEILTKLPRMEVTGEPEWLYSDFINGIRHLPVDTH